MKNALQVMEKGNDKEGIYIIMEALDKMLWESKWVELDSILESINPREVPIDFSMTFLTLLWLVHKKIKFEEYAAKCREAYTEMREEDVEGLMSGFEDLDNQPKSPFLRYD